MPILRVGSMSGADPSRRAVIGGALAAGAAIALPAHASTGPSPRVIACKAGRFAGLVDDRAVLSYRGIRYGRAERFRAPRPFSYGNAIVRAHDFGPVAPQAGDRYGPQSEDCLYLNIWTKQPERREKLPVMLYIHGGAYSGGSVTDPLNDGAALAARGDVVVVTVNHRLNAFGFLYLAKLGGEKYADSGNVGMLDIVAALNWVKDNIAAFGGDPGNVTISASRAAAAKSPPPWRCRRRWGVSIKSSRRAVYR